MSPIFSSVFRLGANCSQLKVLPTKGSEELKIVLGWLDLKWTTELI